MAKKELLEYDYVFYLDADMKIVDYVNNEIITDLLGIQHPGFWEETKKSGTPETRKNLQHM
jgi:hypothetical protein